MKTALGHGLATMALVASAFSILGVNVRASDQIGTLTDITAVLVAPNTKATAIVVAAAGSTVLIEKVEGQWFRVAFEDSRGRERVGFIEARYVRLETPPSPQTSSAQPPTSANRPQPTQAQAAPSASTLRQNAEVSAQPSAPQVEVKNPKKLLLDVMIVDRRLSDTTYSYVSPITATSRTNSFANCTGNTYTFGTVSGRNVNLISDGSANCVGSATTNTLINPSVRTEYDVAGATFTLRIPDGRHVIVNCDSKYALKGDHINRRSCRTPLVDNVKVEFNGNKAKLIWPVSIDGKKTQSETYNILAILN